MGLRRVPEVLRQPPSVAPEMTETTSFSHGLLGVDMYVYQGDEFMEPVKAAITEKLTRAFAPSHLEVINESHQHNVPPGSESHFKVVLASAVFAGKRPVQRHQAVYAVLAEELRGGVHALALHTHTPEEWQATGTAPQSPPCLGGKAV